MLRKFLLVLVGMFALAACDAPATQTFGADGRPLPGIYKISDRNKGAIQFRMLDSVNVLRKAAGASPVSLNARLNAAAATHSRDMSIQNRPWHFGADGSSPLDRLARVRYRGGLVGETISESFETELETLSAWMQEKQTRDVILDPRANEMGIAWFQEPNGKIWWTMILGQGATAASPLVN